MAGYDSITEDPPPSRTYEEDDDFWRVAGEPARVAVELSEEGQSALLHSKLKCEVLVVGLSSTSQALLECLQCEKVNLGVITLPAYNPANPNAPRVIKEEKCDLIGVGPTGRETVIVCGPHRLPAERSMEWTRALFDVITTQRVVILHSTFAAAVRGEDSAKEGQVFRIETDAWKSAIRDESKKFEAEFMPRGALVDGLAAAILSYNQLRHFPAILLSVVEHAVGPNIEALQVLMSILKNVIGQSEASQLNEGGEKVEKEAAAILLKKEISSSMADIYV